MEIVKGKRNRLQREEWIEINPADGPEWALEQGDHITVEHGQERLSGVVRFNSAVPRGVAASTALFGQLAIEMEASTQFEPATRLHGLTVRRARLTRTESLN